MALLVADDDVARLVTAKGQSLRLTVAEAASALHTCTPQSLQSRSSPSSHSGSSGVPVVGSPSPSPSPLPSPVGSSRSVSPSPLDGSREGSVVPPPPPSPSPRLKSRLGSAQDGAPLPSNAIIAMQSRYVVRWGEMDEDVSMLAPMAWGLDCVNGAGALGVPIAGSTHSRRGRLTSLGGGSRAGMWENVELFFALTHGAIALIPLSQHEWP